MGPEPEPTIATHAPRKCRHPKRLRTWEVPFGGSIADRFESCACGHVFDPKVQRRGRAVRKYGIQAEHDAAKRLGLERRGRTFDPEDLGGALDPAVVQAKTGPGFASLAWIRELEALEIVARNRPRILLALEKPGRGRRGRRLVVMFEEELVRLTGLDARRKNLERYVEAVAALRRHGVTYLGDPVSTRERETIDREIEAAWIALEQTPAR